MYITICAVCVSGGTETVLGCFNFETDDPAAGFDTRDPNKPLHCSKQNSPFPSVGPGDGWDDAKAEWPEGKKRYLPK
jgi:hypothetical protein